MRFVWTPVATLALLVVSASAAWAAPAASLLKGLKLPLPKPAPSLFAANAIGQTSLNTQLGGTPEQLLAKVKSALSQQGYTERTINTVSGAWGFNLVMDPPSGTTVDGTPDGKTAALVLQSTAIGPGKLNLNVRFEGL
ncbi:hypothetical protein [Synechococcus sp. CS-1328]|uniref:hypothetical protein n=1 Tax=Synechococcus sp. CS-1328 TaxID=2847976 RepID=UPI00223C2DE9|nr:hypothetical protein [Synechococcus sp. CS-1328]MCT0224104.1 hypothetical protein [Synechococcus sp. CS-1328]